MKKLLAELDERNRRALLDALLVIALLVILLLCGCVTVPEVRAGRAEAVAAMVASSPPSVHHVTFDQLLSAPYQFVAYESWPDGIELARVPATRVEFYTNSAPGYGTWVLPMTYYLTNLPVEFDSTNSALFWKSYGIR